MKTAVLLDSSSDLDLFQADELGVDLLMQTVEFAGEVWLDQEGIDFPKFYASLAAGMPYPKNSTVSVDAYCNTLERMLRRVDHVFAIHPRRHVNGALEVARQASVSFPGRVTVHEAVTLSISLAMQAKRAVRWLSLGAEPSEVLSALTILQQRLPTVIVLENTEFVRRNRETVLSPLLANVNPAFKVVVNDFGELSQTFGTAPNSDLAFRMCRQRLQRIARDMPGGEVAFYHRDAEVFTTELTAAAKSFGLHHFMTVPTGLVLSANLGPGAYGFCVMPRDQSEI